MTVPAITVLSGSYESKLKAYYATYQTNPAFLVQNFWQSWLDPGITGIESAAPFVGSHGVTNPAAFAPLPLETATSVADVANILATAWKNYQLAITWPLIPPVAPFSAINSIVSSPTGVAAAYATLVAGLIAELALLPPDPLTAFQEKADAFSLLFRTASLASGIQLVGLGTGGPPPPLTIPLSPVM